MDQDKWDLPNKVKLGEMNFGVSEERVDEGLMGAWSGWERGDH